MGKIHRGLVAECWVQKRVQNGRERGMHFFTSTSWRTCIQDTCGWLLRRISTHISPRQVNRSRKAQDKRQNTPVSHFNPQLHDTSPTNVYLTPHHAQVHHVRYHLSAETGKSNEISAQTNAHKKWPKSATVSSTKSRRSSPRTSYLTSDRWNCVKPTWNRWRHRKKHASEISEKCVKTSTRFRRIRLLTSSQKQVLVFRVRRFNWNKWKVRGNKYLFSEN
mgnify:CR=1 FL=1